MSKLVTLLFLAIVSVFATTVVGENLPEPYKVTGKVYCDTCRCGFETNVTTYIHGAIVELQCYDKSHTTIVFRNETVTTVGGQFTFVVSQDHGDQYCDAVLKWSPLKRCKIVDPGRDRARVIVTNSNGIKSYRRYANNMGFFADKALPICGKLLKYYLHFDDDK
ncbi:hypothetical protein RND81_06G027100 [Saponaria officinalis]|uniref:Uncharacterized protein n=1 Tax=Saponaria officinalis TaxID=3572 RepID=A0AAW1K5Z4_SAPOF